jgi:hypothetical protein
VTNVLSVQSRDTVWVVADRRLSCKGRRLNDDAVKVIRLETNDGVGVLAYAGLGATPRGTQPSEWMSAVLRGRGKLTFEEALGTLATVAAVELPRHLEAIPDPSQRSHVILAPAFITGVGARLYTIDYARDVKTGQYHYRYARRVNRDAPGERAVRIAGAGSGAVHLSKKVKKDKDWSRTLMSLVRDHDRGKVSDNLVADQLAALNFEVHEELAKLNDQSVGPRSIVIWSRRRDALQDRPGGGHLFYDGTSRVRDNASIPIIVCGMDIVAMSKVFRGMFPSTRTDVGFDLSRYDPDKLMRRLDALPDMPDDKLR